MQLPITLDIDVTQEDIEKGIPKSVASCPIALASKRALEPHMTYEEREEYRISVSPGVLLVYFPFREVSVPCEIRYMLPSQSHDFIYGFDKREPVEPISLVASFDQEW